MSHRREIKQNLAGRTGKNPAPIVLPAFTHTYWGTRPRAVQ